MEEMKRVVNFGEGVIEIIGKFEGTDEDWTPTFQIYIEQEPTDIYGTVVAPYAIYWEYKLRKSLLVTVDYHIDMNPISTTLEEIEKDLQTFITVSLTRSNFVWVEGLIFRKRGTANTEEAKYTIRKTLDNIHDNITILPNYIKDELRSTKGKITIFLHFRPDLEPFHFPREENVVFVDIDIINLMNEIGGLEVWVGRSEEVFERWRNLVSVVSGRGAEVFLEDINTAYEIGASIDVKFILPSQIT